jgi:N-acetylglucosaminyl-diphospho-decaprenol L-rhamnosyltransferase
MKISIVIPVFNQFNYTKLCLDSLRKFTDSSVEIIVINNASSDETAGYLSNSMGLTVINNPSNIGCAGAWNQGVNASGSEWVVILNNDVILSPEWLEGLLSAAEMEGFDIVSPAIREGIYNYWIEDYSKEFVRKMADVTRPGTASGICFMVNRKVFETAGLFDEKFRIGQFEDKDFFVRASSAGFKLGITGRSFIHHFGSVTQNFLRKDSAIGPYEAENREYFRRKWKLTWLKRFLMRQKSKSISFFRRTRERILYGHSLNEDWNGKRIRYY